MKRKWITKHDYLWALGSAVRVMPVSDSSHPNLTEALLCSALHLLSILGEGTRVYLISFYFAEYLCLPAHPRPQCPHRGGGGGLMALCLSHCVSPSLVVILMTGQQSSSWSALCHLVVRFDSDLFPLSLIVLPVSRDRCRLIGHKVVFLPTLAGVVFWRQVGGGMVQASISVRAELCFVYSVPPLGKWG